MGKIGFVYAIILATFLSCTNDGVDSNDIKDSEEVWADTCLSCPPKIEWNDKILMYDMNNVIRKLEHLYSE